MIANGMYRSAIACAIFFELQPFFDLEDLLIPCMLQDRIAAVEAYMNDRPVLQREFVQYFDKLIALDEDC